MSKVAFSQRLENLTGNTIKDVLKLLQQPEMISFAGGMPSPDAFPLQEINEILLEISQRKDTSILQYSASEGYEPLREYIAQMLREKGMQTTNQEILITSGSQQGIDLAAKAYLNSNDKVFVEDPTYLAAIQIFRTYEASLQEVRGDEEGICVNTLKNLLIQDKERNKLLYLIPTFHNPTGKTMSEKKRKDIINAVKNENIIVIEDDPYGDLRYSGEQIPSLKAISQTDKIIYLGTFSKIIAPGLRIGYTVASRDILDKMMIGKQATDVHTANINQVLVYEFCRRGLLKPHIAKISALYKEKRNTMLDCMKKYFPAEASWIIPEGGLFIWVELPENISSVELLKEAVKEKVAFIPGNSFYANSIKENTFRLNFSNASLNEIEKGIQKLGEVMKKFIINK